eukprot:1174631-Pyramimonas_sp.AAC.1
MHSVGRPRVPLRAPVCEAWAELRSAPKAAASPLPFWVPRRPCPTGVTVFAGPLAVGLAGGARGPSSVAEPNADCAPVGASDGAMRPS